MTMILLPPFHSPPFERLLRFQQILMNGALHGLHPQKPGCGHLRRLLAGKAYEATDC
ncbi:hypothetical protein VU07_03170 [Desulfobulbus sp. F4]|nr:hypothetical protein [Desulfobulbus sp. F4]